MSMKQIQINVQPKPFTITGRFFKVVKASDTLKVRFVFLDDSELETELYQGLSIELGREFKQFFISSTTQQESVIFASQHKLNDDRNETSLNGSASLVSGVAALTENLVTEILPIRLGRKSALLVCESDTHIGGSNLDVNNGIFIAAGDSIELDTQAAIFGLSSVPNAKIRILSEVN